MVDTAMIRGFIILGTILLYYIEDYFGDTYEET